jgi:hypothetical protein
MLRKVAFLLLGLMLLACAGVLYSRSQGAVVPGLGAAPVATAIEAPLAANDSTVLADFAYDRCRLLLRDAKKSCYEEVLLAATERGRIRLAMTALQVLDRKDPSIRRAGHDFTHVVGINAWGPGKDVSAVYEQCTELYQSGCYHGVVQSYLDAKGSDSTVVASLCEEIAVAHTVAWLRFQCVHGLGHGLVQTNAMNLPRALGGCDWLGTGWDRESCYGGAFMEFIVGGRGQSHHPHSRRWPRGAASDSGAAPAGGGEHAGHGGDSVSAAKGEHDGHEMAPAEPGFKVRDKSDPLYPCSILADRYLQSCYGMQAGIIIETTGPDFGKIAAACDAAPVRLRPSCYQGIGTYVSGFVVRDPAKADRLCSLGSSRYRAWCYVGVVKNFIDVTAKADDGIAFCGRLDDRKIAIACYVGVGEELGVLVPGLDAREKECAKAGPANLDACRYGAALGGRRPVELDPAA